MRNAPSPSSSSEIAKMRRRALITAILPVIHRVSFGIEVILTTPRMLTLDLIFPSIPVNPNLFIHKKILRDKLA